jgi:DNA modification methylase
MIDAKVICGDAREVLKTLPDESVQCVVTSPPYFGLRDYGVSGQIGLETSPADYVDALVEVFSEVRRVLMPNGTLWLNLGDSYANDGKWSGYTGGKHTKGVHGTLDILGLNQRT